MRVAACDSAACGMRRAASVMMPCAPRCRYNLLGQEGGAALAGGLTALTGLQTLDLGYGAMGGWCGVLLCAEGGYGCALALARRRCLTVDALLW